MSEEFAKDVKMLLAMGKGDSVRLGEILDSMKQNNPVYMSDYKYVESLLSEETTEMDSAQKDGPKGTKMKEPLEFLRIRLAEGKITIDEFRNLKKILSDL